MNIFDLKGKIDLDTKEFDEKLSLLLNRLEEIQDLINGINKTPLCIKAEFIIPHEENAPLSQHEIDQIKNIIKIFENVSHNNHVFCGA